MKRFLLSILVILVVIGSVGAGAFAWFQDTETSTGNTFQAGTLYDLKIMDGDEYWCDGVHATWMLSNMKPGDSTSSWVNLIYHNEGTITPTSFVIGCDYTIVDPAGPESDTQENTPPDYMAKQMIVTAMQYSNHWWRFNCLTGEKFQYNGTSWSMVEQRDEWKIRDIDSDGKLTLYDLEQASLTNLIPPIEDTTEFSMSLQFDPNAGNDFQGGTLNLTMIFTAMQ